MLFYLFVILLGLMGIIQFFMMGIYLFRFITDPKFRKAEKILFIEKLVKIAAVLVIVSAFVWTFLIMNK